MPTLSEAASKDLLGAFGVPFPDERVVATADEAVRAADEIGYPVVAKLGGDAIAHKTERGLVRLGLGSADAVREAVASLLAAARPEDGEVHVLVAPMLRATLSRGALSPSDSPGRSVSSRRPHRGPARGPPRPAAPGSRSQPT